MKKVVMICLAGLLVPMAGQRVFSQDARTGADQASAYRTKWKALLKGPDFEKEIPAIRAEIDAILKSDIKREEALLIASQGYEAIADDEGQQKVESLVLSELPESDWARQILWSRALGEKDVSKQEMMIEQFIARYPGDRSLSQLYATLFRLKAAREEVSGVSLAKVGEGWIRSLKGNAHETVRATERVAIVLAERRIDLDTAQLLADDAARLVDGLSRNSAAVAPNASGQGPQLMAMLREWARTARGVVLLKRGRVDEAAKELTDAFQPVIKQVDASGLILWKDMYLREVGVRPRVLWLAELYEAQGDYPRAVKYLLAGYSDNEAGNRFIRARLPVIYQKLGRSAQEADSAIRDAESRYALFATKSVASKEEEKKKLVASRLNMPAPDFKIMTLDRKEVRLTDLKGKVVVLNFWATWCGPCVAEMPYFQKSFEMYRDIAGVAFFAVSIDHALPAVRPFIQKNGYTIPMAYDGDAARSFNVKGIPLILIIDRDGMIQYQEQGYGGEGVDYVERLGWRVEELLKTTTPAGASRHMKER